MTAKKKATKFIILIILLVFVVITGLSAIVPFSGGNKNIAETDSGTLAETGMEEIEIIEEETTSPTMTPEEARQQLQELLSGSEN